MGAWVIGHNLAGDLSGPDAVSVSYAEWADAWSGFEAMITDYADTDDDAARDVLNDTAVPADYPDYENSGYGDDEPSMLADVKSWLADDSPSPGDSVSFSATDNNGRTIVFWLIWSDDRNADEDDSSETWTAPEVFKAFREVDGTEVRRGDMVTDSDGNTYTFECAQPSRASGHVYVRDADDQPRSFYPRIVGLREPIVSVDES